MRGRDFYTYEEAASALSVDHESFRQILLRGGLDAYVEISYLFGRFEAEGFEPPSSGKNEHAEWKRTVPLHDHLGIDYELRGWFRVFPESLSHTLRVGGFVSGFGRPDVEVWPWKLPELCWEEYGVLGSFHLLDLDGTPKHPGLKELWFSAEQVDSEAACLATPTKEVDVVAAGPKQKLRSDREQNLLRVIAGLWALSGLPPEHYTTADKLTALFTGDAWRWEKPDKDAVARVLKEAANLPGAAIGTSD